MDYIYKFDVKWGWGQEDGGVVIKDQFISNGE